MKGHYQSFSFRRSTTWGLMKNLYDRIISSSKMMPSLPRQWLLASRTRTARLKLSNIDHSIKLSNWADWCKKYFMKLTPNVLLLWYKYLDFFGLIKCRFSNTESENFHSACLYITVEKSRIPGNSRKRAPTGKINHRSESLKFQFYALPDGKMLT